MLCRQVFSVRAFPCTMKKQAVVSSADFCCLALAHLKAAQHIFLVIHIGVFIRADDFWLVRAHRPKGFAAVRKAEVDIAANGRQVMRAQRQACFYRHQVVDINKQIDLRQPACL